nr:hypothetical protein [uncultured Flavobacterium sp.]
MEKTWEKEADKFKIEGLTLLSGYDVYNLLVSAIEGGSNYWYFISDGMSEKIYKVTEDMEGQPFVDRMLMAIQKGLPVKVRDIEEPNEILGTLTAERWATAEKLLIEKQRSHLGDILKENDDATTADVFFQLAVMGELVYG